MRSIRQTIAFIGCLAVFLIACDKADILPVYENGTPVTLSASASSITPAPADSNKVALTLSWSNPKHATDSGNYKFIVEIDSAGKNFSMPNSKVVTAASGTSYTAKELNNFLVARGYAFNAPVDMDVRVISSYANNNERLASNVLKIRMTPYKVPPKVALPASGTLLIVGGATQGGWNNPVPVPAQELTRMDETTFGGIFQLTAGQSYLLLPQNGSWDVKYGAEGANNSNNPLGDNFKAGGGDLLAPAATGWYKLIFDFQTGRFTVTPFDQQHGLPSELFIVGDATPGEWNNPVPVPTQKFTRVNSTKFELTLPLSANKKYLLLPSNGSWDKKFGSSGAASNTRLAGTLAPEGGDINGPDVAGTYKITVDFINNSYTLVKQ